MGSKDVLKVLKKDAKARQKQQGSKSTKAAAASAGQAVAPPEPAHKFFVSHNWKQLVEKRPNLAPKAREAAAPRPPGCATNVVALDCEMVGVGPGGKRSVLARVSIVDCEGKVLMDKFVRPKEYVTDFRTHITGITPGTFKRPGVISEDEARAEATKVLDGKIVVGHGLQNDFQALLLSHPHVLIRDTSLFRPLRPPNQTRTPSLRKLAQHWLQETIQDGTHDSVLDARIALRLYALKSKIWEKHMRPAMQHHSGAVKHPALVDTEDEDDGERVEREAAPETSKHKKRKARSGRSAETAKAEETQHTTTKKKAMKKKRKNISS